MSNLNPDQSNKGLSETLAFFFRQVLKESLHTAIPGRILTYDAHTKRARVQPLIRQTFTDGRQPEEKTLIADVPVLHPSGGGYVVHLPLRRDDPVMLVFSERGLSQFKATFQMVDPDKGFLFDEKDAVALPGFGALRITPATDGVTVQTEDGVHFFSVKPHDLQAKIAGTHYLRIQPTKMELRHEGERIELTDGNILLQSTGSVVIQGANRRVVFP